MKSKIIAMSLMLTIMFGFVLFGGGSGQGFSTGFVSSNKVAEPVFLSGSFFSGASVFGEVSMRPIFTPSYNPVGNLNFAGAFRWNFFDP